MVIIFRNGSYTVPSRTHHNEGISRSMLQPRQKLDQICAQSGSQAHSPTNVLCQPQTTFAPSLAAKPICPQTSCANRKARDWGIACNAPRGALSGARSFPSPRVRIRPHLCLSLSEPQSRSFKSLSLKSVKSLSLPNQSRLLPTSRWQMPSLSTERVIGLRNARLRGSGSGSRSRR